VPLAPEKATVVAGDAAAQQRRWSCATSTPFGRSAMATGHLAEAEEAGKRQALERKRSRKRERSRW